jgi:hypothetical protein
MFRKRPPKVKFAKPRRDWITTLGMLAVGAATVVSSFSGLDGLAAICGWGRLSSLLWVTVDAYGAVASRLWMRGSGEVRGFARTNAIGAVVASVAGNATYHWIIASTPAGQQPVAPHWGLVVGVAAVPAVVLGLLIHLGHLAGQTPARAVLAPVGPYCVIPAPGTAPVVVEDGTGSVPAPQAAPDGDEHGDGGQDKARTKQGTKSGPVPARPRTKTRTKPGTKSKVVPIANVDPVLLARARKAAVEHHARTEKDITRDELKAALKVGSVTASKLLRALDDRALKVG